MRILEQVQRKQFTILKTDMILGLENRPQTCLSTGISESHVLLSAGKSTDKNISLRHWFVIDSDQFSSVQFSRSVGFNSLRPHESQHTRPPCPSPTPRVHLNSSPSSRWCHPAISSSVVPFSSCPQSLQASESFPMSQLLTWGGQSIGVSLLASVLPKNTDLL